MPTKEIIADAKHPITLRISRKMFEDAKPGDPRGCVIAKECRRRFPKLTTIYVGASVAILYKGNRGTRYRLSKVAKQAIQLFDVETGWPKNKEIRLVPQSPSQTLARKREKNALADSPPAGDKTGKNPRPRKRTIRGAMWLKGQGQN